MDEERNPPELNHTISGEKRNPAELTGGFSWETLKRALTAAATLEGQLLSCLALVKNVRSPGQSPCIYEKPIREMLDNTVLTESGIRLLFSA